MKIRKDGLLFLDTGKIDDIRKYLNLGIVDGVTTNPTIMKNSGVVGGFDVIKEKYIEIANLIDPLPLSVELAGNKGEMLMQGCEFSGWAKNINVKITITDQKGIPHIDVIKRLSVDGIKVNATAIMSVSQGLIAANLGAKYVSMFAGRIANMGYDPMIELSRLRNLIDKYGLDSQIIAASSREALNIIQWLEAGAHIVTVTPNLLVPCLDHPFTRDTVAMFDKDSEEWLTGWRKIVK